MIQNIYKFFSINWNEKSLLLESTIMLIVSTVIWHQVPFSQLIPFLGERYKSPSRKTNVPSHQLRSLAKAIHRAKAFIPWECTCIIEALAAEQMLSRRRIDSTLIISIQRQQKPIAFHASLKSGEIWITGGRVESPWQEWLTFTKTKHSETRSIIEMLKESIYLFKTLKNYKKD